MNVINNNSKISIPVSELIYILFFASTFGARAAGLYEGLLLYKISLVVAMLLFGLKVLITKHTILEYIIIALLILEALIVYAHTGEKGILINFTIILGMKYVSRKRIEKFGCIFLGLFFTVITTLASLHLIKEITYDQVRFPFGSTIRRSLGYPHPNTLMTTYIILVILIMSVLEFQNLRHLLCISLFLEFIGVLLFIFSTSNTGIIVCTFYLITNFYFQARKHISKLEKVLINSIYPLFLFISIPLPYLTLKNPELSRALSTFSHTRWRLSQYFLTNEKITLFGSRFKEMTDPGSSYVYIIDSSYLYSFLQVGLITFFIVTTLHLGMIAHHTKNENRKEIAVIVSLCLLGWSDPFLFNLSCKNIMFLYIGELLWIVLSRYQKGWKWNKDIQLIKWDQDAIFAKSNFINILSILIKNNYMRILICYTSIVISVSLILCALNWNNHVDGILDTVNEWNYFRDNIAISHCTGLVLVFLLFLLSYIINRRNLSHNNSNI